MKRIITYISHHPLITAFLLNICFTLAALLFCDPKFETSDDFVASAILSGAYEGTPDVHLLFSNILLGYCLRVFYIMIPSINWYFVFLELLGFLSITVILYLIMKNTNFPLNIVLSIVILCYYTDEIYVSLQFTKIASAAILAGGMLFVDIIWCKTTKRLIPVLSLIFSIFLFISGTLVRIHCFIYASPFLFLFFCKYAFESKNAKKIIIKLVPCLFLILLSYTLSIINGYIWNSDSNYSFYAKYNPLRGKITDTVRYDNEYLFNKYYQEGLDMIDYDMLNSWGFRDLDIYTLDTIETIGDIEKQNSLSHTFNLSNIPQTLMSRNYITYPSVIGLILILLAMATSKKDLLWSIFVLGVSFAIIVSFILYGRLVYRVESSIFLAAASVISATKKRIEFGTGVKRVINTISFCSVGVGLVIHSFIYIPDKAYKSLSDSEYLQYQYSSLYNSENYLPNRVYINVSTRRSLGKLIDHLENDREHYYLLDFTSTTQILNNNYSPWISLSTGYFRDNYTFLSGCDMNYPGEIAVLEANGIDSRNPYKSLINKNIYLVDNYLYDLKLAYLRKYWYPNAEVKLIDEINGFKIWKYYVPEEA